MKLLRILFYQYYWFQRRWHSQGCDSIEYALSFFNILTICLWGGIVIFIMVATPLDFNLIFWCGVGGVVITNAVLFIDIFPKKRFVRILCDRSYFTRRNKWIAIMYGIVSYLFLCLSCALGWAVNNELISFLPIHFF